MFETASHVGKVPEGVRLMRDVRSAVGESSVLMGVGGITPENAHQVLDAGASGVAVISSVFRSNAKAAESVPSLLQAMS